MGLYAEAASLEEQGIPFATVTITGAKGIVPRKNGRMFVAEDGTTTEAGTLEFVNDYTKLHLSKQDATTGKELPGAHMELRDEKGNLVDKWTSTDKPHVIEKIVPGDYILHEEIAPVGYKLAQDISFTVEETGTIQKVVMEDELSLGTINPNWFVLKTGRVLI